jgi:hypothetical protein
MNLQEYINEEHDLAKWGETFGKNHGKMPDEAGFHKLCVAHMKGNIDDPEGYCARVKDAFTGSTYWRGKDKTTKQAKKDIKKHQNVGKEE